MAEKLNQLEITGKSNDEQVQQLLKLVPKENKSKAQALLAVMVEQHSIFSGPIPPAEQFASYEKVLSGSAERILTMAEKQQEHRIELEKKAIASELQINKRGQIFGFISMLILLGVVVFFVLNDMKTWGGVVSSVTIVLIIALFVGGKVSIKKDLNSKR